jgi:hypothetical protein
MQKCNNINFYFLININSYFHLEELTKKSTKLEMIRIKARYRKFI